MITQPILVPTVKQLIAAFEAIYLIRIIETRGTEKKPIIFFEDQGEAHFLFPKGHDE